MRLISIPVGLLLMYACSPADPDCDDGFEERDGICYEEEGDDDDDNGATGGALTRERFAELFEEKLCAEYATCNPDIECQSTGSSGADDCDYNRNMAQQCLNGTYVCNDEFGEGFEFVEVPAACGSVFTNCPGTTYY